jgi:hypothetical protein
MLYANFDQIHISDSNFASPILSCTIHFVIINASQRGRAITKVLYNSTRDDYGHSLGFTRVHYQGHVKFYIVCRVVWIVLTWLVDLQRKSSVVRIGCWSILSTKHFRRLCSAPARRLRAEDRATERVETLTIKSAKHDDLPRLGCTVP